MARRGLSSHRPAGQAGKRLIHWGDEMGLPNDHLAGSSYHEQGQMPVIPGTGQRFGCNMLSTINNRGQLAFMVFTKRFTAAVMIAFLGRLLRHADRKVFLIVDRHPVHRSQKVTRWIAQHSGQIERFFIPGDSPKLNPGELLNQGVKTNAHARHRPTDQNKTPYRGFRRTHRRVPLEFV